MPPAYFPNSNQAPKWEVKVSTWKSSAKRAQRPGSATVDPTALGYPLGCLFTTLVYILPTQLPAELLERSPIKLPDNHPQQPDVFLGELHDSDRLVNCLHDLAGFDTELTHGVTPCPGRLRGHA